MRSARGIRFQVRTTAERNPAYQTRWGEYWLGLAVEEEVRSRGGQVVGLTEAADVLIVLWGGVFQFQRQAYNVAWILNWPEKVSARMFSGFDTLYAGSPQVAQQMETWGHIDVEVVYGITPKRPRAVPDPLPYGVTFVGNCRGFRPGHCLERRVVEDLLAQGVDYDLRLWGSRHPATPRAYVAGEQVPYPAVDAVYAGSAINLNDHWPRQVQWGILGNRTFDVPACGGFLLSDAHPTLDVVYGQDVAPQYHNAGELGEWVRYYLGHPAARRTVIARMQPIALQHSCSAFVERVLSRIVR